MDFYPWGASCVAFLPLLNSSFVFFLPIFPPNQVLLKKPFNFYLLFFFFLFFFFSLSGEPFFISFFVFIVYTSCQNSMFPLYNRHSQMKSKYLLNKTAFFFGLPDRRFQLLHFSPESTLYWIGSRHLQLSPEFLRIDQFQRNIFRSPPD